MPKKAKAKKKAAKKAAKKNAVKKVVKKAVKKPAKKTAKKPAKKAAKKKVLKKRPGLEAAPVTESREKPSLVTPGPQPTGIPPVEEPPAQEEAVGTVTHYYLHLSVAVIQVNKGSLRTGDKIHIKGHTTDFTQTVESMEYEHQKIEEAKAGQSVGIKVIDHAREHDIVYIVK